MQKRLKKDIKTLLEKSEFSKEDIISLLKSEGDDKKLLFAKSESIKQQYVDNIVYFRGLIEFSNQCSKDCFYCGIRKSNIKVKRYQLTDAEILNAAQFAIDQHYGSIVLQSGEIQSPYFTHRMEHLITEIKALSSGKLGITLSCGEQDNETYRRWFNAGAHRYLLRIETSDRELYARIHPTDKNHRYDERIRALQNLKSIGYQTGTGVMIGLPFQTIEDLADDLLFMKNFDIDMCGMGPFIEHQDTPLYAHREKLMPLVERFEMTLKMIAILRIMMKNVNIASTTALQAIDKMGREKALKIGANILMPNITPGKYRNDYKLYENKPCTDEEAEDCVSCLEMRIKIAGSRIGYDEWGDSKHFSQRRQSIR